MKEQKIKLIRVKFLTDRELPEPRIRHGEEYDLPIKIVRRKRKCKR